MSALLLPDRRIATPDRRLWRPADKRELIADRYGEAQCMSRFVMRRIAPPVSPAFLNIGAGGVGFVTNRSWNHPTGFSSSSPYNCALIAANYNSSSSNFTAAYGGVSMTNVRNYIYASGFAVAIFILFNPPTGAQTASINCASGGYVAANSFLYTGVASYASAWNAAGTASGTLTAGNASDLWFMAAGNNTTGTVGGPSATPTGGATNRLRAAYSAGNNYPLTVGEAPGTNTAITWTSGGTSGGAGLLLQGN